MSSAFNLSGIFALFHFYFCPKILLHYYVPHMSMDSSKYYIELHKLED